MTTSRLTTGTEPAVKLAHVLNAVATHLYLNPDLPTVNVLNSDDLQVHGYTTGHHSAGALLAWAETLPSARITASRYQNQQHVREDVLISVAATIHGQTVRVWDALDVSAALDLEPGQSREIALDRLRRLAQQVTA